MSQFTPGPWHPGHLGSDGTCQCATVVDEGYAGGICTVHIGNGLPVGEGGNDAPSRSEAIANMHLIAAAPDMFAALKGALELAELAETLTGSRSDDEYVWDIQAKIKKALAKAVSTQESATPSEAA